MELFPARLGRPAPLERAERGKNAVCRNPKYFLSTPGSHTCLPILVSLTDLLNLAACLLVDSPAEPFPESVPPRALASEKRGCGVPKRSKEVLFYNGPRHKTKTPRTA